MAVISNMDDYGVNTSSEVDVYMPVSAPLTWERSTYEAMLKYGGGVTFTPGTRGVAGIVYEPDGVTPAEGYTVRLYDRATGALRDETTSAVTTGAFSFTLLDASPVYLVAIDDLADTWNAPIIDLITPLEP